MIKKFFALETYSLVSDWNEESIASWEKHISSGFNRFLLRLGFGLMALVLWAMFTMGSVLMRSQTPADPDLAPLPIAIAINLIVAISCGWIYAYITWLGTNKAYRIHKAHVQ